MSKLNSFLNNSIHMYLMDTNKRKPHKSFISRKQVDICRQRGSNIFFFSCPKTWLICGTARNLNVRITYTKTLTRLMLKVYHEHGQLFTRRFSKATAIYRSHSVRLSNRRFEAFLFTKSTLLHSENCDVQCPMYL